MVNSTQAPEKRESARKGKVQSITDAKFPVNFSSKGSTGPSEKVATAATECEVELLDGRRIVSNELKTKRRARGRKRKKRRKEGDLHQGTKHWPGERDDHRGSRESRREGARERVGERTTPKYLYC